MIFSWSFLAFHGIPGLMIFHSVTKLSGKLISDTKSRWRYQVLSVKTEKRMLDVFSANLSADDIAQKVQSIDVTVMPLIYKMHGPMGSLKNCRNISCSII